MAEDDTLAPRHLSASHPGAIGAPPPGVVAVATTVAELQSGDRIYHDTKVRTVRDLRQYPESGTVDIHLHPGPNPTDAAGVRGVSATQRIEVWRPGAEERAVEDAEVQRLQATGVLREALCKQAAAGRGLPSNPLEYLRALADVRAGLAGGLRHLDQLGTGRFHDLGDFVDQLAQVNP